MVSCSCGYCNTFILLMVLFAFCWHNLLKLHDKKLICLCENWSSNWFLYFSYLKLLSRHFFFIITTFLNAFPLQISLFVKRCGFWPSPISLLTFSLHFSAVSLLLSNSSHPWEYAVSIFTSHFQLFGREEKSTEALGAYGATLFNHFFHFLLQDIYKSRWPCFMSVT